MIAVDTNILVYAHREDSPFHNEAARVLTDLAESPSAWAIPWPCLHEFLAIVTHPRLYNPPTPLKRALAQIDAWLESPSLVLLSETDGHWPVLRKLTETARIAGPQIHDARVAAICFEHQVKEFWSADRDFGRFRDLPLVNPIVR